METEVKGHYSHSRKGRRFWVPAHRMETNSRVHRGHEERLDEEIEELEKQKERG